MPFFEDLFKNKKLKELESTLQNQKTKLDEKMVALGEYLVYLREHDNKKEIWHSICWNYRGYK